MLGKTKQTTPLIDDNCILTWTTVLLGHFYYVFKWFFLLLKSQMKIRYINIEVEVKRFYMSILLIVHQIKTNDMLLHCLIQRCITGLQMLHVQNIVVTRIYVQSIAEFIIINRNLANIVVKTTTHDISLPQRPLQVAVDNEL